MVSFYPIPLISGCLSFLSSQNSLKPRGFNHLQVTQHEKNAHSLSNFLIPIVSIPKLVLFPKQTKKKTKIMVKFSAFKLSDST